VQNKIPSAKQDVSWKNIQKQNLMRQLVAFYLTASF